MDKIRVGVMGASGRMGQEICKTVIDDKKLELVAAFDRSNQGMDICTKLGRESNGVLVSTNLVELLETTQIDVMIDFTIAQAALDNIPVVLNHGVHVVAGTTGLSQEEIDGLGELAKVNNVGMFLAANFAIGAVLMMKFAEEAAKFMPHVEVIEMHHDNKLDAPSGTAVTTLKKIAKAREAFKQGAEDEYEKIEHSRGGEYEGMRVHSVRLPGYIAHKEVIFGGLGQT